jgi:hypothetical protein
MQYSSPSQQGRLCNADLAGVKISFTLMVKMNSQLAPPTGLIKGACE